MLQVCKIILVTLHEIWRPTQAQQQNEAFLDTATLSRLSTMFTVLSSSRSYCQGLPGSSDERTGQCAKRLPTLQAQTEPTGLGRDSWVRLGAASVYTHSRHLVFHVLILKTGTHLFSHWTNLSYFFIPATASLHPKTCNYALCTVYKFSALPRSGLKHEHKIQ